MAAIISAVMLMSTGAMAFPMGVYADTYYLENGSVTVEAKDDGFQYVTQADNSINGVKDADPVISTDDPNKDMGTVAADGSTTNTITIIAQGDQEANVTLKDVNIDVSETDNAKAVDTTGAGDVTIQLDGTNQVKSGDLAAGIQKENTGTLTITDTPGTNDDSLNATGGDCAAAIGGGFQEEGSNITITGDTIVTATGGESAAAIGGGFKGEGSYITIEGNATVTATGGYCGAGIGGGQSGDGNHITIKDDATVTATGDNSAAAIGGGNIGQGDNLTIKDNATVTATGGYAAAGIGGGNQKSGSNINISGNATVTATGGTAGTGLGGGNRGDGDNITIEDNATVTATGGNNAAGIGGGNQKSGSNINISGNATVTATGGEVGAGIGGGLQGAGSNINISGDTIVTATGGDKAAAIGGGFSGAGTNITISGGEVTATGGLLAAAIGGGNNGAGTNITISGGIITAYGGENGSGIGSGRNGTASGITISGGSVTATGGTYYPGIGGNTMTDDVIISGAATVNAAGGVGDNTKGAGAAIGTAGGYSSSTFSAINGTEQLDFSDLDDTGSINIYPAGTTIAQMSTTQPTTTYIRTVIPPNPSGQNDKVITNDNNNNAGDPNNNVTSDTAPVDEAHAFVASTDAKLQEHINKILALINSGKIAEANALIANGILLDTGRWYTFNKDTCALIEKASQLGIKVTLHYEYDHTKYSTTIPARTMISPVSLCNADGFVGFMNFYKYYGGFVRSN